MGVTVWPVALIIRFYMGGAGSGSPIHWHNDAVNYAVHGSKLWTLLPPSHAIYSRRHASFDAAQTNESLGASIAGKTGADIAPAPALRCVQRAGDLIFVPDGWGHGVLNLDASVGFAKSLYAGALQFIHRPHRYKLHANDDVVHQVMPPRKG